jgi:hypothetical protein
MASAHSPLIWLLAIKDTKYLLHKSNVVRVAFFCNAPPIAFVPLSPILLLPIGYLLY